MEVLLLNYFASGYLFVYFNIDSHNVIRLTLIMDLVVLRCLYECLLFIDRKKKYNRHNLRHLYKGGQGP